MNTLGDSSLHDQTWAWSWYSGVVMTVMVAVASGSAELSVAMAVIGVSVTAPEKPWHSAAGTVVEMGVGLLGVMSIGSCWNSGSGKYFGCIGTITWGVTCGVWRGGSWSHPFNGVIGVIGVLGVVGVAAAFPRWASGSRPLALFVAWRLTCLLKWSLRMKRLSHTGQANLFSPVWVRKWRASSSERANLLPQPSQLQG